MLLVYVACGGAFGAVMRYLAMGWIGKVDGDGFPYATMFVNIMGSFLLGAVVALMAAYTPRMSRELHALLAIGVLGGFTTFSTFSMDVFYLLERGQLLEAACYIILSVGVSVAAFFAGMWMLRAGAV